jgi:type I restriction enzyme S subunit
VTTKYGHPFASETFNTDRVGVPVIRIRDVIPGRVQTWADETPATEAWVTNGDIVIGMDGDFNHRLWDAGDAAMNQRVCALRPGPRMDRRYLNYVVGYPLKRINETVHYTTVKHLSFADLLAQRVPVPPLETQRGIADMLDAETARIDTLIEKIDEAIRLLRTRREALITASVTECDYPTVPLENLAELRPSGVDKHSAEGEQPVRLCNYTDVYYRERICGDLDFMRATATPDEIARFALRPGDIAITKDSETADDIGVPALVTEPLDAVLLGYHNALVRPRREMVEPRFLLWFLASRAAAAHWEIRARGVTRVGLRYDDIAKLPVPTPDRSTQRGVADVLDAETARVDTLIEKKKRLKPLLVKRREALITAAVTGEIEV